MKYLFFGLAAFALLAIETGIFGQFNFLPIIPPLLVVFCATLVPLEERSVAIFTVVLSGVMLDFVSSLPDGIMLISLAFACLASYILVYWWLVREYNLGIMFASVLSTVLVFFISVLVLSKLFTFVGLGNSLDYGYLLTRKLFWTLLMAAIVTYPIYFYYQFVSRLATKKWFVKSKF